MACSVFRDGATREIKKVEAENGRDSNLFKELLSKLGDKEKALNSWLISYTPTFRSGYEGTYDGNYEPSVEAVLEYDEGAVDTKQLDILKKLVNVTAQKTKDGYIEPESFTAVSHRVSDLVAKYQKEIGLIFNNDDTTAADIGTTIHLYAEELMKKLIGSGKSDAQIRDTVNEALLSAGITTKWADINTKTFNAISDGIQLIYDEIQENQKAINEDQRAVILTEQIVHDKFKDLAGTLDLTVVYSDGRTATYDFKTMFMGDKHIKKGWAPASANKMANKMTGWNIQASNYKEILRTSYGVTDFAESRIVPIGVDYKNFIKKGKRTVATTADSIKTVYMRSEKLSKPSLEQIPLSGELTGDRSKDRVIVRLEKRRESLLAKQRAASNNSARKILAGKIFKIDTALKELILHNDAVQVMRQSGETLTAINSRKVVTERMSPAYLGAKDLMQYKQDIELYLEILGAITLEEGGMEGINSLEELTTLIETKGKKGQDKFVKEIFKTSKVTSTIASLEQMKADLETMIIDRAQEEAGGDIDFKQPGKNPGIIGRLLYGIAEVDNPIFQRFTELFTRSRDVAEEKTFLDIDLMKEKHKALKADATRKGSTVQAEFNKLINPKTKHLNGEVNEKFYEDIKIAREKEDVAWFKANTEFNLAVYERGKEMHDAIFTDPSFDPVTYFGLYQRTGESNIQFKNRIKKKIKEKQKEFVKYNDPTVSKSAWVTSRYMKFKPSAAYRSDFSKMISSPENKVLKEYYDTYVALNEKYDRLTGAETKIKRNFIANVSQSMVERLFELGAVDGVSHIFQSFGHSLQVREQDELLGRTDPDTGERIKSIPLLYSDEISIPLDKKEKAAAKELATTQLTAAFIAEGKSIKSIEFAKALEEAIEKAEKAKEFEKGRGIKSIDLTKSMIMMANSVHRYSEMRKIEDDVLTLREILANGDVSETLLDEHGRLMKSRLLGKMATRIGVDQSTLQLFDDYMDYLVYGKSVKGDISLGNVSSNKLLGKLHDYLSLKALALNPILGAASYLGATASLRILGKEGRMFTDKQLQEAFKLTTMKAKAQFNETDQNDDETKTAYAISMFRPSARDLAYEEAELTSASWGNQNLTWRNAFVFHRKGDDHIDDQILIAMMKSHVIDDSGYIVPQAQYPEGKSVFDSLEIKDGKGTVKYNGDDIFLFRGTEYTKFRNKVRKVAFNVKGSVSEEHRAQLSATALGKMVMKFRSWMPGLVQSRWGEWKYDNTLEALEVGRFRVLLGQFTGHGLIPALKSTKDLMVRSIPFLGAYYKGEASPEYITEKFAEFMKENPHLADRGFTENDIAELIEDKLKGAMVEVRMYTALFAFITFLAAGLDWDDRDENNMFTRTVFLVAKRTALELSFFWSPESVLDIVNYPFPVMSLIDDLMKIATNTIDETRDALKGENSYSDTTDWGYYTIKNVPLINQVLNFAGFFNPSRFENQETFIEEFFGDEKEKKKKKK